MQITAQFKLVLTREQVCLIDTISKNYIAAVNATVSTLLDAKIPLRFSSKDIVADLPSAVKNQVIRDAHSVCNRYRKAVKDNAKKLPDKQKNITTPILKKLVCIWNNQNYTLNDGVVSFPVMINGASRRIQVSAVVTEYQKEQLKGKQGTLRITKKNNKYIAQISVESPAVVLESKRNERERIIMGVDLGLKVPAVAVTQTGKTRFFGNGRLNKYVKRNYRSRRKKLGKAKKLKAIKKLNNKEQRWMKDQDHKISKAIIDFARENNVSVIRMERLSGIRSTARTSRKNEKNLHTWSFYRVAFYIEYKAALYGILVEYVDPRYTSQTCPMCGTRNKAKDRSYACSCGYHTHRDRVGAMNSIDAPVIDGHSLSA